MLRTGKFVGTGLQLMLLVMKLPFEPSAAATAQTCGMPVNVKGTAVADLSKTFGRWYEYMYHTPGMESFNCVNEYVPIGMVPVSGSPKWGIAVAWSESFLVQYPDRLCFGLFNQANFTSDGQRNALMWLPQQATGAPVLYSTLFTDYKTVEISYRCNSPPEKNKNGMCDDPYLWVNTRTKPAKLKQWDIAYIDQKIEQVLHPYCFGKKDLKYTGWNEEFPRCQPKPPQTFVDLVRSLRTSEIPYPTQMAV